MQQKRMGTSSKVILNKVYLREWFTYDKDLGCLRWRKKHQTGGLIKIGEVAGSRRKEDGRMYVHHRGKRYLASRLIYTWHHGILPKEIDHIDRDPTNDRIENLRCSTRRHNVMNRRCAGKSSQWKGISRYPHCRGWAVNVWKDGSNHFIGSTLNEEDAALAWNFAMFNMMPEEDHQFINWNHSKDNICLF